MTDPRQRPPAPVLVDLDEAPPSPAEAPPVPEADLPQGRAMQQAALVAARRGTALGRWFWGLLVALVGTVVSVMAWDFVLGLMDRMPALGYGVAALAAALALVLVLIVARELLALRRLTRLDHLHHAAAQAHANGDLTAARRVVAELHALYARRDDTAWGRQRLAERQAEQFDADALLGLAEDTLMAPLDRAATAEIEAAARQVAMVTALVPLAFADVAAALTANLRMIRRIAQVYGGRAGTLGGWRLTRAVMTHLVATGAVAVGDDMLGSLAGGSVLSRLSRRFGEGLVNGALTARVGVAAIEVCRPLPFLRGRRPSVGGIVKRALTGLFPGADRTGD